MFAQGEKEYNTKCGVNPQGKTNYKYDALDHSVTPPPVKYVQTEKVKIEIS